MSLVESILLGIVQGLTEFLPISSSAHQRIVPALLGWEDPGAAFTAVTQIGTETAVVIYFRHEVWAILTTWLRSLRDPRLRSEPEARMGWYLIVATIPIAVFGLVFEHEIETGARNLWLIGTTLVVFGIVLGYADWRGSPHTRSIDQLSTRDGVLIGLAQSLALIPGVSRSGATMSAGLLIGLERPAAAKFGFLLAIPAVVASGVFQLQGIISGEEGGDEPLGYVLLATAIAFVVGYAAIAWFLRYLSHHSVRVFVGYRLALGSLELVHVAAGAIS